MKFAGRKLSGWIGRFFYPDFSACGRCGRPWPTTAPHNTYFSPGRAAFPLCKPCWSELTIEQRIPYYLALIIEWGKYHNITDAQREAIIEAVRKGK